MLMTEVLSKDCETHCDLKVAALGLNGILIRDRYSVPKNVQASGRLGTCYPIASFSEADLVPLRNGGVTEGLAGIVFGVSLSLRGPFGGGVNDAIGWERAFLIQVPLVFICTAATKFLVQILRKKSEVSGWRRIDYVGGITALAALLLIQLVLNSGSTSKWNSPIVYAPLPTRAVLFAAFLYWELYLDKEPLRLFRVRNVLLPSFCNFFGVCSYFSVQFYVPIYLQVMGLSTVQNGLRSSLKLQQQQSCFSLLASS
jgi:hypothetical protein